MAGSGMDEKKSIRDSARTLKKYGSTSNHLKRQEHFVKHMVSETDTLQGIALKYGVTVNLLTYSLTHSYVRNSLVSTFSLLYYWLLVIHPNFCKSPQKVYFFVIYYLKTPFLRLYCIIDSKHLL